MTGRTKNRLFVLRVPNGRSFIDYWNEKKLIISTTIRQISNYWSWNGKNIYFEKKKENLKLFDHVEKKKELEVKINIIHLPSEISNINLFLWLNRAHLKKNFSSSRWKRTKKGRKKEKVVSRASHFHLCSSRKLRRKKNQIARDLSIISRSRSGFSNVSADRNSTFNFYSSRSKHIETRVRKRKKTKININKQESLDVRDSHWQEDVRIKNLKQIIDRREKEREYL